MDILARQHLNELSLYPLHFSPGPPAYSETELALHSPWEDQSCQETVIGN